MDSKTGGTGEGRGGERLTKANPLLPPLSIVIFTPLPFLLLLPPLPTDKHHRL